MYDIWACSGIFGNDIITWCDDARVCPLGKHACSGCDSGCLLCDGVFVIKNGQNNQCWIFPNYQN